jgi:fermentation-respiration switch protein FrsA (DUF1100 family)
VKIVRTPLVFPSQGTALAAVLHRDVDNLIDARPAVIVVGSWLTVKEQMAEVYAQRLAALGYTAFSFDFAGFGESGGAPRQLEMPARKIADIMAAADFLASLSCVRRGAIGCVAVCASAQYTLAALARGARIDAFISVAGWYHDAATVAPFYGGAEGVAARLRRAADAARTFLATGESEMVPAYDPNNPNAGMFFELPYYALAGRGAVPAWKNQMAVMSWLHWLTFDGLAAAAAVRTPSLFVHSDGCVLPDNLRRVHAAVAGRKELVWAARGGQLDFYDQPDAVDTAVAAADAHLRASLAN